MSDAMDTNSGEENRYGVAALDQLDDDDGPPSSSAAKQPASAADSEAKEGAEGQAQPEVESYALAIGVIEPPPDLKSTCRKIKTQAAAGAPLASTAEQRRQALRAKQSGTTVISHCVLV
jgi:hypothetical protein